MSLCTCLLKTRHDLFLSEIEIPRRKHYGGSFVRNIQCFKFFPLLWVHMHDCQFSFFQLVLDDSHCKGTWRGKNCTSQHKATRAIACFVVVSKSAWWGRKGPGVCEPGLHEHRLPRGAGEYHVPSAVLSLHFLLGATGQDPTESSPHWREWDLSLQRRELPSSSFNSCQLSRFLGAQIRILMRGFTALGFIHHP